MDTVEILTKAKSLIENPEKWHKGHYFKFSDRSCMCGLGAVVRAIDEYAYEVIDLKGNNHSNLNLFWGAAKSLDETVDAEFSTFNDAKYTNHEQVMLAFDKTIERLSGNPDKESFSFVIPIPVGHIADYYQQAWENHKCLAFQLLRKGYRQLSVGYIETDVNNLFDIQEDEEYEKYEKH